MAMTVRNDSSSMMALGQLKKNDSSLSKQLKKVASGMRINDAGDDASAYSISERMQVKIRSLGQCENNTETGKKMLTVAERAVGEQIDICKKLKENALKSANDTCTDVDRATIQKETNQLMTQMEDISNETNYNGIPLLNGRTVTTEYTPEFRTRIIGDTVQGNSKNDPSIQIVQQTATPTKSNKWKDDQGNYLEGYGINAGQSMELNLNFSNLPDALHNQGFSSLCNGCYQFASIVFDSTTSSSIYSNDKNSVGNRREVYVIGIKDCTTAEAVGDALLKGLMNAKYNPNNNNGPTSGKFDTNHGIYIDKDTTTSPAKYSVRSSSGSPQQVIYNGICGDVDYDGGLLPYKNLMIQGATKGSQETKVELPDTSLEALFPGSPIDCELKIAPKTNDYPEKFPDNYVVEGGAEYEYYNKKYKCNGDMVKICRAKWYDEEWPYARKGASASDSCVSTRNKAVKFIDDVDQALKYLLHCSTNLGAQCQRMDVMKDNLVTSDENTQAAESTIRDADMAKEMTGYTKANILAQSAQAMLAQANQNSSSVLGLLQ